MPREQKQVTVQQLAALKAINDGRVPAAEVLIAKLKRKGLISRPVFNEPKRRYLLTDAGRAVLTDATDS